MTGARSNSDRMTWINNESRFKVGGGKSVHW